MLWLLRECHPGRRLAFFFSSRRRHTRSKRDWSSDVCSSDLSGVIFTISHFGFLATCSFRKKGKSCRINPGRHEHRYGTRRTFRIIYVSNLLNWQASIWLWVFIGVIAIIGLSMYLPYIETVPPHALADRLKMFLNKKVTITVFITFFASISSLGLYTYLAPLIKEIADSGNLATYLWAWGLGGLFGSLIIGYLIDYFKEPKTLVTI